MPQVTVHMDIVDLTNAQHALVTGKHVDNLQGLLKGTQNASWDPGSIDGKGGPKTKAAVLAFQSANQLQADAKVGETTWGRLIPFGP